MATINDIGVAGQPLSTPPLTAWQAAVRDALTPLLASMTPAAGWVEHSPAFGLQVTKLGRIVTAHALMKPTTDTTLVAASPITIATIPASHVPGVGIVATCYYLAGTPGATGRLGVSAGGTVQFYPAAAGTMTAAAGYVGFAVAYRSAT